VREVFVGVASVYDDEESVLGSFVDNQVIDNPAVLMAHDGVKRLADLKSLHIVGNQKVEKSFGIVPFDKDLSHMTDVEEPDALSASEMFVDDPGVLNRQFPSSKVNESSAQALVFFVNGGASQHEFTPRRARVLLG